MRLVEGLREKKALITTVALLPGWIIPRIVGTLAFLHAPSWIGLISLISWWVVVPILMWVGVKLWKKYNGRIGSRLRPALYHTNGKVRGS